jgi:hypothetical protein
MMSEDLGRLMLLIVLIAIQSAFKSIPIDQVNQLIDQRLVLRDKFFIRTHYCLIDRSVRQTQL